MNHKLALLPSLKLSQLKHIAIQCGINSSGTKPLLTTRLSHELNPFSDDADSIGSPTTRNASGHVRILSIDMGIRNLAYCVLDMPRLSRPSVGASSALPSLLAWQRMAVVPRGADLHSTTTDGAPCQPASSKETFEPAAYAAHAYNLLSTVMLPHEPTQVLIERQRYRSMGGAAIQEWTVRVNMFEGMLHAVLRTLRERGTWRGAVQAVSPAKVGPFWIDPAETKASSLAKSAKARNKAAKVDLVGRWLTDGHGVAPATDAARTAADAFSAKWRATRRKSGTKTAGAKPEPVDANPREPGKLDDLADCLLQGLAWMQWEVNKSRIAEGGLESMGIVR